MPSNPTIRAALDAALGDLSQPMQREIARRIARFLRAMPAGLHGVPGSLDTRNGPALHPITLAAAIEAEAKEAP